MNVGGNTDSAGAQMPEGFRDAWASDTERLPRLADAPTAINCAADLATDLGTHTLSIGTVSTVRCAPAALAESALTWLAAQRTALSRTA